MSTHNIGFETVSRREEVILISTHNIGFETESHLEQTCEPKIDVSHCDL